MALFGGKRLTPGITARLNIAFTTAVERGRLRPQPTGLILPVAEDLA